jgi:hypothetical protein|tara:strand:- start:228 stop:506 length:279 start_codon:yes stop_codon:yes gene_type:complete
MEYEIHTECLECDGYGTIETRVSVDRYTQRYCADCDGSGLIMHTETYDSVEDAKADYPESFIRPTKWNREQAIQRGEMIANQILGPTLGFRS